MNSGPNVLLKDISILAPDLEDKVCEGVKQCDRWKPVSHHLGYAHFANQLLSVWYISENKAHSNEYMSHSHAGDLELKLN